MNKIVLGLVVGAVLGALDGLTALFSAAGDPEIQDGIVFIVIASTIKGLIAGALIGWFAKKVDSLPLGIAFGLLVGLGLAWLVASQPTESGKYYYWEIMLPGSIVGAIVGYATQRYGRSGEQPART